MLDVYSNGGADALFDSTQHTTSGAPHVSQFLWDRYKDHLAERIEERIAKGLATITLEEAIKKAPAVAFIKFCAGYLAEHRVVQSFFVDMNHGIQLDNNERFVICPGTEIRGTMQPSHSVDITESRSQMDGVRRNDISVQIQI